jgi:hypothetical protein
MYPSFTTYTVRRAESFRDVYGCQLHCKTFGTLALHCGRRLAHPMAERTAQPGGCAEVSNNT